MATDDGPETEPETEPAGRSAGLLVGGALLTAGGVAAFLLIDPILAAALVITGVTLLVIGVLARDWDRHPTFEDREMARARKRKAKWERTADARARDRARWEAHQARRAKKAEG